MLSSMPTAPVQKGTQKKGQGQDRVSYRTEVNFWVVIDRHINLLLRLSWASVVRRWVIIRDDFHRFFQSACGARLQGACGSDTREC